MPVQNSLKTIINCLWLEGSFPISLIFKEFDALEDVNKCSY
jgi:hypothetical protein